MMTTVQKARAAHRKTIETFYEDTCTVYEYRSVKDEKTKITAKKEVTVIENQPCRISFESIAVAAENQGAAEKKISIKLFLSPDITIREGSKIEVMHKKEATAYSNSGVPAKYSTHQEIRLQIFERWT